MSGYIAGAVWLSGPQTQSRRFVLLAIADNANDTGFAWPSVEAIANKCLMSKRTVLYCLEDLEREGWITVDRKSVEHKGNSYQIVLEKLTFPTPKSSATIAPDRAKVRCKSEQSQVQSGTKSGANGDIAIRKNRHRTVNRTVMGNFEDEREQIRRVTGIQ